MHQGLRIKDDTFGLLSVSSLQNHEFIEIWSANLQKKNFIYFIHTLLLVKKYINLISAITILVNLFPLLSILSKVKVKLYILCFYFFLNFR